MGVVVRRFFGDMDKKKEVNNLVVGVVVREGLVKEVLEWVLGNGKREVEVKVGEERIRKKGRGKREDFEMNG